MSILLLVVLSVLVDASPYDGVHVSTNQVVVQPSSDAIYFWVPFVTPKTWVALNPRYLKVVFRV